MRSITYIRLALRSVRFYWRTQLCACLGVVVAGAVLVGGLLVGDCVSLSLKQLAMQRLGRVQYVVRAQGRYFSAELANRLANESATPVAPALIVSGMVVTEGPDGGTRQVNRVQVVGVDARFGAMSMGDGLVLQDDSVCVNGQLARSLGVGPGADVSVRVGKGSVTPQDAPLTARDARMTRRGTFRLQNVLGVDQLGRFSLEANQVSPHTVFVDLAWLQKAVGVEGRANVLLVAESDATAATLTSSLSRVWQLEDSGLSLRGTGDVIQLESERVFLDPEVERVLLGATTLVPVPNGVGALSYLVSSIRCGNQITPYAFAVAIEPSADAVSGPVPSGMTDDQVIVNSWLADALDLQKGSVITLEYQVPGPGGTFVNGERMFTVRSIVPVDQLAAERARMPVFPGLTDVDRCADWDIGMPTDPDRLRDAANQAYWEEFGPTPKLFVTLQAGREMWGSRFGNVTAIRYRAGRQAALADSIAHIVGPDVSGFVVQPAREEALKAVDEAMSFGELFLYMSVFLVGSALMLTGMLFVFGIEQRSGELGLLLSVGYRIASVRTLFILEGAVIAIAGAGLGALVGLGYTRLLIAGLTHYWNEAVADTVIHFQYQPTTLLVGMVATAGCGFCAMLLLLWRRTRRPAHELLQGETGAYRPVDAQRAARVRAVLLMCLCLAAAGGAIIAGVRIPDQRVYAFFASGFMILVAGVAAARLLLQHWAGSMSARLSLSRIGVRAVGRRGRRSLTVIGLLASGTFIVLAVAAMQQDIAATSGEPWSGTGGFSLLGEASVPLVVPLESDAGRERYGLDFEGALRGVEIVSMRVRDGDDASCFNLNRARTPRLLGVDTQAFIRRRAFMARRGKDDLPWSLLDVELPDGAVPALAGDANTAMWNLHKGVGDELVYRDGYGREVKVRIVGVLPMALSVFQGTMLVAMDDFESLYPSEPGYRMILVDASGVATEGVSNELRARLSQLGVDLQSTLDRLLAFHRVEATYLNMFLVLGGLGVILGTYGLGLVVMRNVIERRAELAMLRCLGFTRGRIVLLVLLEHWVLLATGLLIGLIAAGLAVYPAVTATGVRVPVSGMMIVVASIIGSGVVSTLVAVWLSLRGTMLDGLRSE